ncbi:MAG: hypothetical protein AAF845_17250 [Bacteroidota bacterium]
MRALLLAALAILFAACDSSEPGICILGPETEVEGGITYRISAPSQGDTLRVGEPFRFTAEVEAVGDVSGIGVELVDERGGVLPETVLFERTLGGGPGAYVLDAEVVLDSVRAGADLTEVYVVGAGRALTNTACGGGYGGAGSNPIGAGLDKVSVA